jgi:gluconolactonase
MFAAPPDIETEVFARLPDELRIVATATPWSKARGGPPLHSFLEGPSFDREGNLYCVDVNHGRLFRIGPDGRWDVFAHYDGNPNGLKIHRDGRIFVADHKLGLLAFDPHTGVRTLVADGAAGARFRGTNDLVFADNGDLYFTDPGESGLEVADGRVFCLRVNGDIDLLMDGLAYPNGLVLAPSQAMLYVAVTRTQQVLRAPLSERGVRKSGMYLQLSGGLAGPDGMAIGEDGSLVVVHAGFGTAWVFSPLGEPVARIRSCAGIRTTNVAFGGPGNRSVYITEAEQGVILRAQLNCAGRPMYSHR